MYIPDFWCGVFAVILVEFAIIVAGTVYEIVKAKGGFDETSEETD